MAPLLALCPRCGSSRAQALALLERLQACQHPGAGPDSVAVQLALPCKGRAPQGCNSLGGHRLLVLLCVMQLGKARSESREHEAEHLGVLGGVVHIEKD